MPLRTCIVSYREADIEYAERPGSYEMRLGGPGF
jgi:hypothetical protein